jgi:hypothetical protein
MYNKQNAIYGGAEVHIFILLVERFRYTPKAKVVDLAEF